MPNNNEITTGKKTNGEFVRIVLMMNVLDIA